MTLQYFSKAHHGSQVVTGFYLFCKLYNIPLHIENHINDKRFPKFQGVYIIVEHEGKVLVYDMNDGYQHVEEMRWLLNKCDFYFKRSYSEQYNISYLASNTKVHPYGFNYFVTFHKNPLDGVYLKELVKRILRKNRNTIFTPEAFEESPTWTDKPQILFSVRLWSHDNSLPAKLNEERSAINKKRIAIVKSLKQAYKECFWGGLYDNPTARQMAPDLIIPTSQTSKDQYLKILHKCDICIASMGLHESIGGKMGEYVAAAKGIVSETLHYSVAGNFIEGNNYLSFETSDECLMQVETLYNNPDLLYAMKQANANYYQQYLKPEILIGNTLRVANLL